MPFWDHPSVRVQIVPSIALFIDEVLVVAAAVAFSAVIAADVAVVVSMEYLAI